MSNIDQQVEEKGISVAQLVKYLLSAQAVISESWDQAPRRAPCSVGSLLLSLLLPFPLLVLSLVLALSQTNK